MSLLGKVLAILNVLAAGAFVYVAANDWAKRQTWSQAVQRLDLLIDGLPVDDKDRDPIANRPGSKVYAEETLAQAFQGAGPVVATQDQEVRSVRDKLTGALNGMPEAKQREKLAAVLGGMARTQADRDAVLHKVRTEKVADLLQQDGPLKRVFDALDKPEIQVEIPGPDGKPQKVALDPFQWALDPQPKKAIDGLPRDVPQKRRVFAHFLANVGDDIEPYPRLVRVIGHKAYAEEANHQAETLHTMAAALDRSILGDRAAFETHLRQLVRQLQGLAQRLEEQDSYLNDQKILRDKHERLVEARRTDVEKLQAALNDAREVTRATLARLGHEQGLLYQAERRVGERQQANERLERELSKREKVGP